MLYYMQVLLLSVIIGPCVAAAAAKQALHTLMVDRLGSTEQGPSKHSQGPLEKGCSK